MAKDSQRGSSADDERELPDEPTGDNAVDGVEPSNGDLDQPVADDDREIEDDDDLDDDADDALDDDDDEESEDDRDDVVAVAATERRGRKSKSSTTTTKKAAKSQRPDRKKPSSIAGAAPGTFIQQVVSELSKVVWPTKKQMITYTSVVLVFVVILVAAVWGFDLGVGKVMDWIFA